MTRDQGKNKLRLAQGCIAGLALALGGCGGGSDSGQIIVNPPPPIVPATVTVSGKVTFDLVGHAANNGLDYAGVVAEPVRGAVVRAITTSNGALLAETSTDSNGDYSLTVAGSTSLRIQVRAALLRTGTPSWNFEVVDNTSSNALYALESPAFTVVANTVRDLHAASGWGGSSYTGERAAGPFAILDSVYFAYNKVLDARPNATFAPLTLNWSPNNRPSDSQDLPNGDIVTSFYQRDATGSQIYLLGAANNDTDEYDSHVVIHEWGHYFEDRFSRSDSIGGSHSNGDRLDPRVAFSEGWGYALAGIVTDNPVTRDSLGFNQGAGFQIDVEASSGLNPGWYSEGSVQSIIYDLYDANSDGADQLALGFGPILDVLEGNFRTTSALTTIFSFIDELKDLRSADASAIDAIVAGQSIMAVGLDAYGSTETNNAGSADVLPVYTQLAPDGSTTTVCSIGNENQFGTFNKLSNRRFVRFNIASAGNYSVRAAGPTGSDPDLVLLANAVVAISDGVGDTELFTQTLSIGEYVLEVYEYTNTTATPRGRTCIDVSVTRL